MKRPISLLCAFSTCLGLVVVPAAAAESPTGTSVIQPTVNTEMIRFAITAERRKVFESGMLLPESQKEAFWGLYGQFETERNRLDKVMMQVLQDFVGENEALGDQDALALTRKASDLERSGEALRDRYFEIISRRISGRVGARFYQIDDFVTSALKIGMLSRLPLVGNAPAAPASP